MSLKFNSTEQLPPNIKTTIGKEINEVGMFLKPKKSGWKEEDQVVFDALKKGLEKNLDVVFVVPGWARVHVEVCAPKFSNWWGSVLEK